MVDNFDLILSLLPEKPVEDKVYHVTVVMRKKDHEGLDLGKNNYDRTVYSNIVACKQDLLDMETLLLTISEATKARIMINLNPKRLEKMAWEMHKRISTYLESDQYGKAYKTSLSAIDKVNCDNEDKVFFLDVDEKYQEDAILSKLKSYNVHDKVLAVVPTKNGCHVLVKPFDFVSISHHFKGVEMKKNSGTILYIPKSLDV